MSSLERRNDEDDSATLLSASTGHDVADADPTGPADDQGTDDGEPAAAAAAQPASASVYQRPSLLSSLLFWWITPVVKLGNTRPLEPEDVPEMMPEIKAETATGKFERELDREFASGNKNPSPLRAFMRVYMLKYILIGQLRVVRQGLQIVNSVVFMPMLLNYIRTPSDQRDHMTILGLMAFVSVSLFAQSLMHHQYFVLSNNEGMQYRAAYISIVFKKMLKLKSQGMPSGVIINMISNDAQRLIDAAIFLHNLTISPIECLAIVVLLLLSLGVSAIPGVAVVVGFFPLQGVLGRVVARIRQQTLSKTDARVRLMTDILQAMKLVKLYGWQKPMAEMVKHARVQELIQLQKIAMIKVVNMMGGISTPMVASITSFCTYVALGNSLDPDVVFPALALFNMLRLPLSSFPQGVKCGADLIVAMKRLRALLLLPELDLSTSHVDDATEEDDNASRGIVLKDAVFCWNETSDFSAFGAAKSVSASTVVTLLLSSFRRAWSRTKSAGRAGFQRLSNSVDVAEDDDDNNDAAGTEMVNSNDALSNTHKAEGGPSSDTKKQTAPFSLKDISLEVRPGELVAIVGSVGAGKSSLLSALLGEMRLKDGVMSVHGRIGYVPQQSWIANATLRENILFGKEYDPEQYNATIHACCLEHDVESLPGGDLTEIGERGVNLSGGQRHRVALARAVYRSESSILLLDDPFHAVDSIVARKLMDRCVNQFLLGKGKAVILVTHQIPLLRRVANCREILVLHEGAVVERGSLDYLLSVTTSTTSSNSTSPVQDANEEWRQRLLQQFALLKLKRKDSTDSGTNGDEGADTIDGAAANKADGKPAETAVFQLVKAEDRSTGTVSFKIFKSYAQSAGGYITVSFVIAIYVLSQAVRMLVDWWLSKWVDAEDLGEVADYVPMFYAGIYIGLGAAFLVILFVSRAIFYRSALAASTTIHNSVFEAVLGAKMSFFDTTPVGRLVNRFSGDVDQIDDTLPDVIEQTFYFGLQVLGILIIVASSLWQMLFVFAPLGYFFWRFVQSFRKISRELKRLESIARSPLLAHISTTLLGLALVRSFGAGEAFKQVNSQWIDKHHKLATFLFNTNRWLGIRLDLLAILVSILTTLLLLLVPIDPALAGFVLSYVLQLTNIFQWFARQLVEVETKMTTVERMRHYIDNLDPEERATDPVVPLADWPQQGEIAFNHVNLRYRSELPLALADITFSVPAGYKIGIVGRTGSGKSSLAVALFRLAESESGSIVIDGINTGDILLERLRTTFAIIPQEPVLFEGTVRSNLDPFNTHSDGDVWRALEQAHMKTAIDRLADGLLAAVTDHGENFSVGERQLLCLARAALRKPKVLLLDEATAAVDSLTDALVQKTIRETFSDCTVLTIAHRLDTIIDANRVLVMSDGHVVEYDEPAVLLGEIDPLNEPSTTGATSGLFAQLVAGTGSSNDRHLRMLALQHAQRRRTISK